MESNAYLIAILISAVAVTAPIIGLSIYIDSAYYGTWTFPPFNFVYINVVENMSRFFGEHPTFYYLLELHEFITDFQPLYYF